LPSLPELAARLGVSRFQLVRHCRQHTGLTPHAWLLNQRVTAHGPPCAGASLAERTSRGLPTRATFSASSRPMGSRPMATASARPDTPRHRPAAHCNFLQDSSPPLPADCPRCPEARWARCRSCCRCSCGWPRPTSWPCSHRGPTSFWWCAPAWPGLASGLLGQPGHCGGQRGVHRPGAGRPVAAAAGQPVVPALQAAGGLYLLYLGWMSWRHAGVHAGGAHRAKRPPSSPSACASLFLARAVVRPAEPEERPVLRQPGGAAGARCQRGLEVADRPLDGAGRAGLGHAGGQRAGPRHGARRFARALPGLERPAALRWPPPAQRCASPPAGDAEAAPSGRQCAPRPGPRGPAGRSAVQPPLQAVRPTAASTTPAPIQGVCISPSRPRCDRPARRRRQCPG
jgi:hypothetical protein